MAVSRVLVLIPALVLAQRGPWPSTEPHWPHYISRNVTVLSGTWAFAPTTTGVNASTVPYSSIVTPSTATVPGCTDIGPPGYPNVPPRGVAYFRSWHECTPGSPSIVFFGAVNMYARVFSDGVEVGNHTAGGYTPFELILPPCGASGVRELALVNSNEQSAALSPTYTGGDFFFYSGIIRPVIVSELPCSGSAWIRRVEASTEDAVLGLLTVRVVLGAGLCPPMSPLPPTVHLALAFHGASPDPAAAVEYPVVNGAVTIASVPVPQPWAPWDLGDRNASLFELRVLEAARCVYSSEKLLQSPPFPQVCSTLVHTHVHTHAHTRTRLTLFSGDILAVRTGVRSLSVDPATARIAVNGATVKVLDLCVLFVTAAPRVHSFRASYSPHGSSPPPFSSSLATTGIHPGLTLEPQ
jgi:hypothetical protein